MDLFGEVASSAALSDCGAYRYELRRIWDPSRPLLGWGMLNPSVADSEINDPTIRRCVRFTQSWGYCGIVVGNLFALISTDPRELLAHPDPVGPENDAHLARIAEECAVLVCAWGAHRMAEQRAPRVMAGFRAQGIPVHCLGITKAGHPKHPLYVAASTPLVPYTTHEPAKEAA